MQPDHPDPNELELDRLLAKARWPEPGAEQIARLGRHWRVLRQARRRRLVVYGALATAASLLVIAGLAAWRVWPAAPEQQLLAADPQPDRIPLPQPPHTLPRDPPPENPAPRTVAKDDPPTTAGALVGRDPSLYEQVVLLDKFPQLKPKRKAARKARGAEASFYEFATASGPHAAAAIAVRLAALHADIPRLERRLWTSVREGDDKRRLAAARLLARIGSADSLPVLVELAADPATHEAALVGLCRLADDRDIARLAAVEPDERLRRQLLGVLLARGTAESVGRYLELVQHRNTRDDALAVLAQMDHPPADVLLSYLESPQGAWRLAAAHALSRLADPAVAERLCQSLGGIGRQEALVALLLSPSPQAAECLNHARQNVYLVAAVQAAERQLHSLGIQRGGNVP